MMNFYKRLAVAIGCTLVAATANAGTLIGTAQDKDGAPLANVVFTLKPVTAGIGMPSTPATTAAITQENLKFSPYVTAIRVGSSVQFPNRDTVEHHIKSFSASKPFEIAVHKPGNAPAPIVFDKEGAVIVYCILHDWMRAFVYVADTPWFAQTAEVGAAQIENVPAGEFEVLAWHPDLGQYKSPLSQKISVPAAGGVKVSFRFDFKPRAPRQPKPLSNPKTSTSHNAHGHDAHAYVAPPATSASTTNR
jgi:plastocyanin